MSRHLHLDLPVISVLLLASPLLITCINYNSQDYTPGYYKLTSASTTTNLALSSVAHRMASPKVLVNGGYIFYVSMPGRDTSFCMWWRIIGFSYMLSSQYSSLFSLSGSLFFATRKTGNNLATYSAFTRRDILDHSPTEWMFMCLNILWRDKVKGEWVDTNYWLRKTGAFTAAAVGNISRSFTKSSGDTPSSMDFVSIMGKTMSVSEIRFLSKTLSESEMNTLYSATSLSVSLTCLAFTDCNMKSVLPRVCWEGVGGCTCPLGQTLSTTGMSLEGDPVSLCGPCLSPGAEWESVGVSGGSSVGACIWQRKRAWVGNLQGFYGVNNLLCSNGFTSEPGYANVSSDCQVCPWWSEIEEGNKVEIASLQTCSWWCKGGYRQVGMTCLDEQGDSLVDCLGEGMAILDNRWCEVRKLPWHPAGVSQVHTVDEGDFDYWKGYLLERFAGDNKNSRFSLVRYLPYFQLKDPGFNVSVRAVPVIGGNSSGVFWNDLFIPTVTLVCSSAYDAPKRVLFMVMCGTSVILFVDLSVSQQNKIVERYIGFDSRSGYAEGMRHEALFGKELYIVVLGGSQYASGRMLVLDTWNCMVREVVMGPDGVRDFRTKTFRVYGEVDSAGVPVCRDLLYPRYWFPLKSSMPDKFLAFGIKDVANDEWTKVCQFYVPFRRVLCEDAYIILWQDWGVYVLDEYMKFVIECDTEYRILSRPGDPCPPDWTSLKGGDCTVYFPWNEGSWENGWYIQNAQGYPCVRPVCNGTYGWFPGKCKRDSQAVCEPCGVNQTQVGNFRYLFPEACDYELIAPCPENMYADQFGVCQSCGPLQITNGTNKTSLEDCKCLEPLVMKVVEGGVRDCVVDPLQPLFRDSITYGCSGSQFFDVVMKQCRDCRVLPCLIPGPGQYSTSCYGPLYNCNIPANAVAVGTDLTLVNASTGWPIMCFWECLSGYNNTGEGCVLL